MKITKKKLNTLLKEGINEYYVKKTRNKKIAQLVKEEYNRIAEGSTDDEWEMVDAVVAALGHEGALDALVQALPSDSVRDSMEYIARMHEIPLEMDEVADLGDSADAAMGEGKDRIVMREGNEASKLIDALGKVGDGIEGVLKTLSADPADAEAVMKGMPEVMKVLNAANEQIQQIWDAMHDMLQTNEETKPHEADRHPADTT